MVLIITNQFRDQYELGGDLGKGTYSIVKKCTNKITKQEYAAKIINTKNLTERDWIKLETEARICKKLNHKNTIHLFDSITEEDNHYFIFDLVLGGELFDEIVAKEYFSERDASRYIKQLLQGIQYCHNNSIIHRDLKPENLLLHSKDENSILKIADFGLALEVDGDESDLYGFAGTPIYISPEVIKNDPYGKPVDIWACGVILYILLVGDLPFWNTDKNDLFFLIKTGALNDTSKEWQSVSDNAKDLIFKMLTIDPERRLTASEALNHSWILNCDASPEHRVQAVNSLKIFNARRKLKVFNKMKFVLKFL